MVVMSENMEVDEILVKPVDDKKSEDNNDDPVGPGQLEDEARKRKERLKSLRQKLIGGPVEDKSDTRKINAPLPKPVFRSYNPTDENFQESAVPKARPIDIETQVADTLEKAHIKTVVEDVDLTSLAPRKPDWDLKRDVAPKLAKLERRTQRAIAELILDRLKNSQQNLAAAVEFSANPNVRNVHDQDDDE